MTSKYSEYNGCKITYNKRPAKRGYFARVPSVTSQYLGVGKTKKEAYNDTVKTLRRLGKCKRD